MNRKTERISDIASLKRILKRTKERYPLAYPLLCLVCGQLLCSTIWGEKALICVLAALVGSVYCALKKERFFVSCSFLLLGVLSEARILSFASDVALAQNQRVELEIQGAVKRSKPNELKFTAIIKKVLEVKEDGLYETSHLLTDKMLYCKGAELPWRNLSGITQGDVFIAAIQYKPLRRKRSFLSFDEGLRRQGYSGTCKIRFASELLHHKGYFEEIRERFMQSYKETIGLTLESGLSLSILLGFRDLMTNPVEKEFQATGLSHLLVFSGAQVVLMYGCCYWLINLLLLRFQHSSRGWGSMNAAPVCSLLATVVFVLFVGIEKSSLRALFALGASFGGTLFERGRGIYHGMLIALFFMVFVWPCCVLDPGVQLTFAALLGIALGSTLGNFLWVYFMTSLLTTAVSVLWFGQFSVIGFLMNPILVPLVSILASTLGVIATIAFISGVDASGLLLQLMALISGYLESVIHFAQYLPFAVFSVNILQSTVISVLSALLCAGLLYAKRKNINSTVFEI